MDKWKGEQLNEAKKILAHELTNLVHGEEETKKAEEGAKALFMGTVDADSANIPQVQLSDADFQEDGTIDICGILVKAGLDVSRSAARRSVDKDHSVSVDGEKVTDFKLSFTKEDLKKGILVRKGKKNYKKVTF